MHEGPVPALSLPVCPLTRATEAAPLPKEPGRAADTPSSIIESGEAGGEGV